MIRVEAARFTWGATGKMREEMVVSWATVVAVEVLGEVMCYLYLGGTANSLLIWGANPQIFVERSSVCQL